MDLAPSEHVVLVFLCQVLVLLVAAKLLGWLMGRIGQPAVVGELLAGVLLGPSLLGRGLPDVFNWLFPDDPVQSAMIYALSWIGLLLLLAATGFESDLAVITKLGRPALLVTAGSLFVPLIGGLAVGLIVPEALLGPTATTVGFAAFLAVALSISSLPVVAKVLAELGLVRRNVGQLILAVAIANDVVGWILLGVVAGLATADGFDPADLVVTLIGVGAFLGLTLTVGQHGVDRLLRAVATSAPSTAPSVVVVGIVIAAGALTHWMGVEAVLGAFVAGLVIGRSRWRDERALRLVEQLAHGLFAPLFFATAGLRIDLGVFVDRTVAFWTVIVVVVASVTKFTGAVTGAWAGRLPGREGLALGAALNARGALEIVIASIGLSLGVLNDASYGVIVVMAIVTSLAAPPLLRAFLADWPGTPDEQRRLEAEQVARSRIIVSERPPLLLTRGNPPSISAAQLIGLCWPVRQPVTVLSPPDADIGPIVGVLDDRPIRRVIREGDPLSRAADVLAEANRGHSAILLGLSGRPDAPLLSPFVESILANATTPVIMIRGEKISGRRLPAAFARAVIPITGSLNSRAALELASAMSASLGTELALTHVEPAPVLYGRDVSTRVTDVAEPLLAQSKETAQVSGARAVITIARTAESIPQELSTIALEYEADIIIIGTTPRRTARGGIQLGPIASRLLELCPATVVVIATPAGWTGGHR